MCQAVVSISAKGNLNLKKENKSKISFRSTKVGKKLVKIWLINIMYFGLAITDKVFKINKVYMGFAKLNWLLFQISYIYDR